MLTHKVLLLFIPLFLLQCGLEQIVALDPPDYVETSQADYHFQFRATAKNDEAELKGFEIYYKFYPGDDSIQTNLTTKTDLVNNGFYRISSETKDEPGIISYPLIDYTGHIGNITAFTVFFVNTDSDNDLDDVYINSSGDLVLDDYQVRRGVYDSGDTVYKDFSEFKLTDTDISNIKSSLSIGENTVCIALYALSYGVADLTKIYSETTYLYYIDITINVIS